MTNQQAPLFDSSFLRMLDRLALMTKRAMAGELQGERRSPHRGSSIEFADFRQYSPGDDFRRIDWNSYARLERFFLKLFVAEEELTVHLLIDTTASMDWGEPNKLQYARRAAGAFGYIALASLDRVTATALGEGTTHTLKHVRGKRSALHLFAFLQQLRARSTGNLFSACRRYAQSTRAAGPLLLCADLLDPRWAEALQALTMGPFEITLLHMLAPQELRPQMDGDFRLIDAESGDQIEITADLDTLRRYDEHLNTWRADIETFCSGHNINYVFVDTAIPVEDLVIANLRQRGIVR